MMTVACPLAGLFIISDVMPIIVYVLISALLKNNGREYGSLSLT